MTPKQANSIAKLEGRKSAFYDDLEVVVFAYRHVVYLRSKKSKYEAYRVMRMKDVLTGRVAADFYRGCRPRRKGRYSGDVSSSAWQWHLLDPNGWKAQVMLMKLWPEWSIDDA